MNAGHKETAASIHSLALFKVEQCFSPADDTEFVLPETESPAGLEYLKWDKKRCLTTLGDTGNGCVALRAKAMCNRDAETELGQ